MAEFDRNSTKDKVIAIIAAKISIEPLTIKEESTLADLGADSLDLMEIIMKIEEQFGVEIDDEKAESLKNVKSVIDYVQELRKK